MKEMRLALVPHMSVNAYADASKFMIGIHKGLMRSVGDDDELAAVLAHEAAHLLFSHAQKKNSNAVGSAILMGIAMGVAGIAMHQPGMDTGYIGDMSQAGFDTGYVAGYVAYSPEMELEADQFAMYVLKNAGRRLSAGTDIIVRLHRGAVPAPVRQGDGWAGYLATHPADDYRLAAMRVTLNRINAGATRPVSKRELEQRGNAIANRLQAGYVPTVINRYGQCTWVQEWKNCHWWGGERRLFWSFRCPFPNIDVDVEKWEACLR